MTLASDIARIVQEASVRDVRSRAGASIWEIRMPSLLSYLFGGRQGTAVVNATRDRILKAIQESSESILMAHQEPPTEYNVSGAWTAVDSWCYRLPPDADLRSREAQGWLEIGGWTVFQTTEAPADWNPQILRRSPTEVIAWMRSRHVTVLVDSFLDDLEWTVAVLPDTSP